MPHKGQAKNRIRAILPDYGRWVCEGTWLYGLGPLHIPLSSRGTGVGEVGYMV